MTRWRRGNRHVRQALAPDGTWMLVEPYAADDVAGNIGTPVGRMYYGSLHVPFCVPHAVSEHAADALGNQAGEPAMRNVISPRAGRLQPVPPGRGDPVQPRVRGPALTAITLRERMAD